MTQDNNNITPSRQIPEAVVKAKKSSISIVWVVPLVALLIGGWMIYKAISEKGPEISISFISAEGLEAEKTKIKYKDVELGQVDAINFSPDLANVIVSAELPKTAAPYLTDKTRFWVVRARVSGGEVSGLGTLLGGAYIEIDPNKDGKSKRDFIGLETPPVIKTDAPGDHYRLKAKKLGSLNLGSPVYYRQIKVGKVEQYALAENGQDVDMGIFIEHPYHQYVHKNTRFWNAGGIDLSVDANGLKVNTQTLVSIVSGGMAFDNPTGFEEDAPPEKDQVFILYANFEDSQQVDYVNKEYWNLVFKGSTRGLKPGAPVEIKGMALGHVMDVNLQFGDDPSDVSIAVLIETEPERLAKETGFPNKMAQRKFIDHLVAKGLRAQLKTGSMLTGQLFVDLDFYPDLPPQPVDWEGKYPVFPTIPKTSEEIMSAVEQVVQKLKAFPVEKIGSDLQAIVTNLKKTTQQISTDDVESILHNVKKITEDVDLLMQKINTDVESDITAMLVQAQKTLSAMEQMLQSDSAFSQETSRVLREVADAAGRIRALADYLERHPDSLIYGKGE